MKDLEKQLNEMIEKSRREEQEKWNNMTAQEKLNTYKNQPLYFRYCDMSIEELEKELEFNIYKANQLRSSKFKDIYYSASGCDENAKRIRTILKLKKEMI